MVTLTGTFTRLDGTPATGTVRVTPSRSPIMDPDGKIVISGPQTFPLDGDGKLTTEIPASNDPDLGPPFTYAIDVNLTHASWKISKVWIPHGSTTVDLSEIGDYQPTPGVATRVVTIPADGADGQVLVWDGAGFSWDDVPEGQQGPKGDVDAEQLAGAPRIVNLALGREFETSGYNNHYKSPPIGITEGDIVYTHRVYSNDEGASHGVIGSIVILVSDTIHTFLAGAWKPESSATIGGRKSERVEITSPVPENATIAFYGDFEAPALFSDINIINLTQVYGAGNEPSLEYMDALVKKHGGYIDGEQFVVGDALQALTVAGPGMSIRHDTTVGERVLLDHPGGTTMLHGDTGWRNVSGLLTNGWTGTLLLRRVGTLVQVTGNSLDPAAATSATVATLPAGFESSARVPLTVYLITTSPIYPRLLSSPPVIQVDYTTSTNRTRDLSGTWTTTAPWPTTLPGTPL